MTSIPNWNRTIEKQKQLKIQNSDLYNREIKKLFEYNILSRIDDSKIYLKSIKIPQDVYTKLKIERIPFFYYENNDMPSWLINFMLSEEFVDLGVIEEDQLFYRLTNSDEKVLRPFTHLQKQAL